MFGKSDKKNCQNALILPYCVLPTHTFKHLFKNQFYFFLLFFYSDMQTSTTSVMLLAFVFPLCFFMWFAFFKFNMLDKKTVLMRVIKNNLNSKNVSSSRLYILQISDSFHEQINFGYQRSSSRLQLSFPERKYFIKQQI